ncbi:hypothetical protein HDC37_000373 [Microbacterium sp. AK009]|uniref:hypothetical protein n=1 Tax=Microbacterium sp. AK009 TaxID=2723068 RepID=UPI0015CB1890|nr:hypothetical protein [Microbacterium sp. AK009]NYF15561.1 hypothetical protein [Microbacterium sp. AK009]
MTVDQLIDTPHARLRVPADWTSETVDGADAVLVAPGGDDGFRANIVVTSVPSSGPVERAGEAALAAALDQHPGALVGAFDLWPPALRGRRLLFTYPAGEGGQVDVRKYVWATGTHHVHLSASAAPWQTPALRAQFDSIGAHVEVVSSGRELPESSDADVTTERRPQKLTVNGPVIPRPALDVLASARPNGRLSRGDRASAEGRALVGAGFATERGRLTDLGAWTVAHWARHDATIVSIERSDGGTLTGWRGAQSVLFAASTPAPGGDASSLGAAPVTVFSSTFHRTSAVVLGWLGAGPSALRVDAQAPTLPAGTIARRIADPAEPVPDGAGRHLAFAWQQPWVGVDLRTRSGLTPLIKVGENRWWRRTIEPGGSAAERLTPFPAGQLYDLVTDQVVSALL